MQKSYAEFSSDVMSEKAEALVGGLKKTFSTRL
jgi:hypothetical protein